MLILMEFGVRHVAKLTSMELAKSLYKLVTSYFLFILQIYIVL